MDESPSLALDPPGAGLPAYERWIVRPLFRVLRAVKSRQEFMAKFEEERQAILTMVADLPPKSGKKPVLIDRVQGMEDSSRYWSVYMTLDHLRIVNLSIAQVIKILASGDEVIPVVSVADVKPDPSVGVEIVKAFRQSARLYQRALRDLPTLKTSRRHRHPWFGELDAAGWHALTALHLKIHRKQIERILAGLKTSAPL